MLEKLSDCQYFYDGEKESSSHFIDKKISLGIICAWGCRMRDFEALWILGQLHWKLIIVDKTLTICFLLVNFTCFDDFNLVVFFLFTLHIMATTNPKTKITSRNLKWSISLLLSRRRRISLRKEHLGSKKFYILHTTNKRGIKRGGLPKSIILICRSLLGRWKGCIILLRLRQDPQVISLVETFSYKK